MDPVNIYLEEERAMGLDGLGRIRQGNGRVKPFKAVDINYQRERWAKPTNGHGENGDLYHYQAYPTAGLTAPMNFFGSGSANLEVTNVRDVNKLPSNMDFRVKGLSIDFVPAGDAGVVVAAKDFYKVMQRGVVKIEVEGQVEFVGFQFKNFPMKNAIDIYDDASAAVGVAKVTGGLCVFDAPIYLEANANFGVELSQPSGAVTVTSIGSIGVRLLGEKLKHKA